jgi:putative transposase
LHLTDADRATLGEIGHRLGREALEEVATAAKPDTILGWYRRLVARKFDGSKSRRSPGRPRVDHEIEALVVRMAKENPSWGYDRIVGALANLGYTVSDQTVGNILRRNGISPAPERKHTTTWKDFIRAHMDVLAGTDFLTVEVLTLRGLVTYYVLFFIHLESRRVGVAGITPHPNEAWMMQIARNVTMEEWGFLENCRYLIHDRDTKFTDSFRTLIKSSHVEPLKLPARSPNLNAHAERWVKSVKDECLSKLIIFGGASLRQKARPGPISLISLWPHPSARTRGSARQWLECGTCPWMCNGRPGPSVPRPLGPVPDSRWIQAASPVSSPMNCSTVHRSS